MPKLHYSLLLIFCASVAISGGETNQAARGALPLPPQKPAPLPDEQLLIQRTYETILPLDEKGFQRLPPPKPGEWLAHYREEPQSLERYKMRATIRPSPDRRTIVLQPLGTFDNEGTQILQLMKEYAEIFFQLPARVEPALAWDESIPKLTRQLPVSRRVGRYSKQYDGETIMDSFLKQRVPTDAAVYLGITLEDLCTSDTNYVFGVASFKDRVGIYSLARYFPEFWGLPRVEDSTTKALRRACKVLNHETGHMFGVSHCVFFRCSMNGSNTLEETDRAPAHFCPLCQRKLMWNIGYNPLKRFKELQTFYAKNKLDDEAEWMTQRIENWKKIEEQERIKAVTDE